MTDITHFRTRLESEKQTLEHELESVGRRNPSNPNDWEAEQKDTGQEADPNDRADLIEQFGENTAILNDLETRYNDVVAALGRIDSDTYGVCEVCGEKIEVERLEADPAAKTCKAHLNG